MQGEFDFLIPYQRRQLLTTPEVAECIRYGTDFVRELIDRGELEAHQASASGERLSNRVTRHSVIVWLAKNANYAPDDLADSLVAIAARMTPAARARLITALQTQNARP